MTGMGKRSTVVAGSIVLAAAAVAAQPASADVYTWLDAAGRMTVSNLKPPADARVTNVTREDPAAAAHAQAAHDAARQAEMQALAQRVDQLEREADDARRTPPVAPPVYAAPASPPSITYNILQPPPQAPVDAAPAGYTGCAYSGWPDCTFSWGWPGAGFYPYPTVIVTRPSRNVHHRRSAMAPARPSGPVLPITHPVIPTARG
jgi:hypothetical protein